MSGAVSSALVKILSLQEKSKQSYTDYYGEYHQGLEEELRNLEEAFTQNKDGDNKEVEVSQSEARSARRLAARIREELARR